jgi:hypothetical protein
MNINRNENIPLGIPTLPPTVAEALIALESLDDCARMSEGIDAYGPRGVLERFIAYYANLPFHGMPLAARPARQAGWRPINEAPDSDDLIWLRRGDNIDGPRPIQSDDCDYYDHFAPCEAPPWGNDNG